MTLGAKIKAAREEMGWQQHELADALNVEPATVSRWESDLVKPRARRLVDMALKMNKPIEWFTRGATDGSAELVSRIAALELKLGQEPSAPKMIVDADSEYLLLLFGKLKDVGARAEVIRLLEREVGNANARPGKRRLKLPNRQGN